MDYEEKYKNALERARKIHNHTEFDYEKGMMEDVFPELMSEDEQIRKALIEYFNEQCDMSDWNGVYGYQVVAWLEKQGKKESDDEIIPDKNEVRDKDEIIRKRILISIQKDIAATRKAGWGTNNLEECIAWLENQGEKTQQTPQWMINFLNENRAKFASSMDYDEQIEAGGKLDAIIDWLEKQGEKKPVEEYEEYNGEDFGIDSLYHAQRILEKTLGEVEGYQSDDGILEHKCAISAVKKLYSQESNWSEEDECYMAECINAIATKDGWSFEEKRNTKHWLKSLKDRYTWKPSDEQVKALISEVEGRTKGSPKQKVLESLYNDLKKLK